MKPRQLLHLLRRDAAAPAALLGEGDWIIDVSAAQPELLRHGAPPLPAGPLSFDELHSLLAAAELVVTW